MVRHYFVLFWLFSWLVPNYGFSVPVKKLTKIEWKKQKSDTFYQGIVDLGSRQVRFKTRSSRLFLQQGLKLSELKAYGINGEFLRNVDFVSTMQVKKPRKSIAENAIPYDADDSAEPDTDDSDLVFFENGYFSQSSDGNKQTSQKTISIGLAFGSESIKSTGGISKLNSDTSIGGTHAMFKWARLNEEGKRTFGFSLEAGAHVHKVTVDEQEDPIAGTSNEEEYEFFRSYITTMYRYFADRWFGPKPHSLELGLGLQAFRNPILQTSDDTTGEAHADMYTAYGPTLAANYRWHCLKRFSFGLGVNYQFLGIGDVKSASRLTYEANTLLHIDDAKFASLAYLGGAEEAKKSNSCPAVTSCEGTSKTSSTFGYALLGFGFVF